MSISYEKSLTLSQWILRNFHYFHYHGSLFFLPWKATLHLALLSRRNFGARSLNRENSERPIDVFSANEHIEHFACILIGL